MRKLRRLVLLVGKRRDKAINGRALPSVQPGHHEQDPQGPLLIVVGDAGHRLAHEGVDERHPTPAGLGPSEK